MPHPSTRLQGGRPRGQRGRFHDGKPSGARVFTPRLQILVRERHPAWGNLSNMARLEGFSGTPRAVTAGTALAIEQGVMVRNQRGFTIIELLVVVAVIAVLTLISFTVYSNVQSRSRLAKAQADTRIMASAVGAFQAHMGQMPAVSSAISPSPRPTSAVRSAGPSWPRTRCLRQDGLTATARAAPTATASRPRATIPACLCLEATPHPDRPRGPRALPSPGQFARPGGRGSVPGCRNQLVEIVRGHLR